MPFPADVGPPSLKERLDASFRRLASNFIFTALQIQRHIQKVQALKLLNTIPVFK